MMGTFHVGESGGNRQRDCVDASVCQQGLRGEGLQQQAGTDKEVFHEWVREHQVPAATARLAIRRGFAKPSRRPDYFRFTKV